MNMRLYPKLALSGIRKNRRLYYPYILTCVGMVMMFYIMSALSGSPLVLAIKGGSNVQFVLSLGMFVIAAFALLFLVYTNSFLVRRRGREFGLYNILGMDKRGIARVVAWESLITAVVGLAAGLALGIALSKFAELGLLNAVRADVGYSFTVPVDAVLWTVGVFAVIFLLLFFKTLLRVGRAGPLELLRSESAGEKPPKANWVLALLGILLLGGAYYISVSIQNPLKAMLLFFVAVIMVIIATYMLFTAGSVAICRALQKRKSYYYKKNHFVSVSSMAFRMRRNGAGLASICVLSTMVLVMLSSTSSLYIGAENTLDTLYPRDVSIALLAKSESDISEDNRAALRAEFMKVFASHGVSPENLTDYACASAAGLLSGSSLEPDPGAVNDTFVNYDNLRELYFLPAEEYERLTGERAALGQGEALIDTSGCEYDGGELTVAGQSFRITGRAAKLGNIGDRSMTVVPSIVLVVPDFASLEPLAELTANSGLKALTLAWYYSYDLGVPGDEQTAIMDEQTDALVKFCSSPDKSVGYSSASRAEAAETFYTTYGGLFFLGIMLSIVFVFAAVLIIYYKQVSEGYEDQSRFEIMRSVGMTSRDIKKSINSQVLTVFFAPLLCAGLHLGFAFPMVWRMLQLFGLSNMGLALLVTLSAFLLFGIFYAAVYKLTASVYCRIVNE